MMEGTKVVVVGGGGGKVGIDEEDMGDGMQCSEHPYRNNNNPGGICAFCLQDKLGKLVSSSSPSPSSFPALNPLRASSSSSSSSPSFRSDVSAGVISNVPVSTTTTTSSSSMSLALRRPGQQQPGKAKSEGGGGGYNRHYQDYQYSRRARIPFLLAKKKKKMMITAAASASTYDRDIVFKRSKSTTTAPGRRTTTVGGGGGGHFMDNTYGGGQDFSPRRRGFWSFLYLSSYKPDNNKVPSFSPASTRGASNLSRSGAREVVVNPTVAEEEEDGAVDDVSPNTAASASSFGRKVSRSRSVGCGSRSFSGDFFERISTGFGDCTLRRVESQREGKPKSTSGAGGSHIKERVRCGGIFGGFIMTSSSSSSSSASYWEMTGKPHPQPAPAGGRGRSSWGWAFASPMRAFSKPAASSKDGKRDRDHGNGKNPTPNLAAIPSLLAVRG